jgi:NAD(P)-dependent dehydrogenase (short-subunit alcohol dehydrogenase family)
MIFDSFGIKVFHASETIQASEFIAGDMIGRGFSQTLGGQRLRTATQAAMNSTSPRRLILEGQMRPATQSRVSGPKEKRNMMLKNKVAVIYGAGGAIGGAVARAFASEGAKLFVIGRLQAPVDAVARGIVSAGGSAEAATIDALDEQAVDKHLKHVIDSAGRIDVSFNAVGVPNAKILGVPLVELDVEQFSLPIAAYTRSYFLTARLAARHMVPNKSGVIMTVTALPSRMGTRLNGGYGPAMAAKEALTRDLSAELAPNGIRVVSLRPHGIPGTPTMKDVFELKATGMTYEQFQAYLASMTHPRRVMTLAEVANMAVFMASDKASGMTGTTVNLTMGSLDD